MSVALRPTRRLLDQDHVGGTGRFTSASKSRTCTIIADEHRPFREGVRTYLGFGFTAVAEAGSVSELAQAVAANPEADLVLISTALPGGGLAAAAKIIPPAAKFVVFASETRDEDLFEALGARRLGIPAQEHPRDPARRDTSQGDGGRAGARSFGNLEAG